eukprot:11377017-Karenia_brevis.AAC.1
MRMLGSYEGGKLCESSCNMNLGPEQVGAPRIIYDLSDTLPKYGITKEIWPVFLRALIHLMSDSMIDSFYNVADTKALKPHIRRSAQSIRSTRKNSTSKRSQSM